MWKDLGRIFDVISYLSIYAAGMLGVAVIHTWGGPLGMAGQMWVSGNTEPTMPSAPWPWVATVVTASLPWPVLFSGHTRTATFLAVVFFFVPIYQLIQLYHLAA